MHVYWSWKCSVGPHKITIEIFTRVCVERCMLPCHNTAVHTVSTYDVRFPHMWWLLESSQCMVQFRSSPIIMTHRDASVQHCAVLYCHWPKTLYYSWLHSAHVSLQWTVGVAEVYEKEHQVWSWGRECCQNKRVQVPSCCWLISSTIRYSTQRFARQSNCTRELTLLTATLQVSIVI